MELSKQSARRVDSRNRNLIDKVLDRIERKTECAIDLTGNTVDQAVFEGKSLQAASNKMMAAMGREAMQYSSSHDYMPLKAKIAERYNQCGLNVIDQNFTVTNGSTQAVDLICKVLVNDGDAVLVDSPLHWRTLQAVSMYEPDFLEVPIYSDGPDTDVLESFLKQGKVRVYFAAPTAQEPGGVIWSNEKREIVAELMKTYDCILIEIDRCGDLIQPHNRPIYMKQLLGDQAVLIGSFSPVLGPGLRIGWVCATDLILSSYCTEGKQKTDSHANGYIQRVLWQYLEDFDFAGHAAKVSSLFDKKRNDAVDLLNEIGLMENLALKPQAGTTLWLKLTNEKSDTEVFEIAADSGILILPGSLFSMSGSTARHIGIDFAGVDKDQLRFALEKLKDLMA